MTETPSERYKKDLSIPCPLCHAETGQDCTGDLGVSRDGFPIVHLNRRIKRLLLEKRPDLLEPMS